MTRTYIVECRVSPAFRWHPVTARPHDERSPFDPKTRVLTFATLEAAESAATRIRQANAGEYRVSPRDNPAPTATRCPDSGLTTEEESWGPEGDADDD